MSLCQRCNAREVASIRGKYCLQCKLEARRESLRRYNHSDKNKASQARYRTTESFAESQSRYRSTEKAKEVAGAWCRDNYPRRRERSLMHSASYYRKNKDVLLAKGIARRRADKERAIALYGGKCVCCGEDRACFLTFDHVNSDGAAHRKEAKTVDMVKWLKRNGFQRDDRLQLLCYNCNCAKQHDPLGHCRAHENAESVHGAAPRDHEATITTDDGDFRIIKVRVVGGDMIAFVDSKRWKLVQMR